MTTTRSLLRGSRTASSRLDRKRRAAVLALDEREDLFELVDDEQELRPVVGEHALHGPEQAELVGIELLLQRGRRVRRDPQRAAFQLLERVGARRHHRDVPAAGADLGHEPGEHDRRLPAAARTDDGEKPLGDHALDEVGDELLAAEEVVRVRLEEGVETLVRVPELGLAARRGCAVGREGRLLAQDAARELPQLRRRLDPELVDEQPTALVVEADGLRLPAAPVAARASAARGTARAGGCAPTSSSSSPTSVPFRPSCRSAAIRRSSAVSLSSSRRPIAGWANES